MFCEFPGELTALGVETRSSSSKFLQSLEPGPPAWAPLTGRSVPETPAQCVGRTLDTEQDFRATGSSGSVPFSAPGAKPGSSPGPSIPAKAAGGSPEAQRMGPAFHLGLPPALCVGALGGLEGSCLASHSLALVSD